MYHKWIGVSVALDHYVCCGVGAGRRAILYGLSGLLLSKPSF